MSKVVSSTTAICLTMREKVCARREAEVPTLRPALQEREIEIKSFFHILYTIYYVQQFQDLLEERENRDVEEEGVVEVGGAEGRAQCPPRLPSSRSRWDGCSRTTSSSSW